MMQSTKKNSFRSRGRGQRGAVLILVLGLLALLMIVSTSVIDNSGMNQRGVESLRDGQVAFQAAEAALRTGESVIRAYNTNADLPILNSKISVGEDGKQKPTLECCYEEASWYEDDALWVTNGVEVSLDGALESMVNADSPPKYIISVLPDEGLKDGEEVFYRVTARGVGVNADTVVILESVYSWIK